MYDMRTLRAPSMQMVTTVAEWGAHPVRQKSSPPRKFLSLALCTKSNFRMSWVSLGLAAASY